MTDELKLITLKMPADEVEALQRFLMDNDLDNRSEVIRRAITSYISGKPAAAADEDGIFVRLNPVLLLALDNMVRDGTIYDAESFIRTLVEKEIIPEDLLADSKARAFHSAQTSFRNA